MTDESPPPKSDDSWRDTYMLSNSEELEFMSYIDKIPPDERAVLLKKLRTQGSDNTTKTRLASDFAAAAAASEEHKDGEDDDVKPPAVVSASTLAAAKAVPARQLRTGLLFSLVPRNDDDLNSVDVILRKNGVRGERGGSGGLRCGVAYALIF